MGAALSVLTFASPMWLIGVPFILLAAWFATREVMPVPTVILLHPDLSTLPKTPLPTGSTRLHRWLDVTALIALLFALAQPQWIGEWIPAAPEGREIMLLVDGSKSMSISDFQSEGQSVERMSVLKGMISQFVQARGRDRFGLIIFGNQAYTMVPPTFDRALVTRMLQRIPVGIAGEDTAIGEALGLALKQLREQAPRRPALILFTDGDNTAGAISPREAVAVAMRMKVPIYTVEIGTDLFGHATQPDALPSSAEREPGLKQIAHATGGRYYQAASKDALKAVIADIGNLEKTVTPPRPDASGASGLVCRLAWPRYC